MAANRQSRIVMNTQKDERKKYIEFCRDVAGDHMRSYEDRVTALSVVDGQGVIKRLLNRGMSIMQVAEVARVSELEVQDIMQGRDDLSTQAYRLLAFLG